MDALRKVLHGLEQLSKLSSTEYGEGGVHALAEKHVLALWPQLGQVSSEVERSPELLGELRQLLRLEDEEGNVYGSLLEVVDTFKSDSNPRSAFKDWLLEESTSGHRNVHALAPMVCQARGKKWLKERRQLLDRLKAMPIFARSPSTFPSQEAMVMAPLTQRQNIRRAVKAELKSMLGDDALVQAYREHGSYRKAAEALSAEQEAHITKDKVRRAVQRNGGAAAVIQTQSSMSIARAPASHRRDR